MLRDNESSSIECECSMPVKVAVLTVNVLVFLMNVLDGDCCRIYGESYGISSYCFLVVNVSLLVYSGGFEGL